MEVLPSPEGVTHGVNRLAVGFLSDEKVSEIRDRSNILEIISDYVALKKTGKNYRGLCPFHSEKTPSFMVNEEKQIFHCFGCGEGGDVFTFLMKAGHFSFPQALEELAKRYGVALPSRELSAIQKKERTKKEGLFQINEITSEYFHDLLIKRREGEGGRQYLSQRGISPEIISKHRLGVSTDRWDGLVQHLQGKKVSLELAWELGLIFPKKKTGAPTLREGWRLDPTNWYDAFRGRILFPIFDLHQRVVGFGGRLIKEGQPKYLNSPESSIYHKGNILYGLEVAKQYAVDQDGVIIVEGYFDLLTLHQYGWKHSVATLGTALTPRHIQILKRYTNNLMTLFDADQAGIQAALRSLPLFLEEEVIGKMVVLPKGEDPDGFLRKGYLEDFRKLVDRSIPLIDFYFDRLVKIHDLKSIDGKVKVAKEGMALLGRIPNNLRRDFYIKAFAERLEIQESFLHEMLRVPSKASFRSGEALKKSSVAGAFPRSEETLIRLMLHQPELIPVLSKEKIFQEFESPVLQRMAETLKDFYQKKGKIDLSEMLGNLEEDLKARLCNFAFRENELEGADREKILEDCIQKIREKRLRKEKDELLKKIREAEKQPEGKRLASLLREHQALAIREKDLHKDSFRKI